MALLEVDNLVYRASERVILDGLFLRVEAEQVHALIGTNGTGKSTLAALVMGCAGFRPTSGQILFDSQRLDSLEIHQRARLGISMAWQEPARFEGLLIQEYLTLGARQADASALLREVGLEPDLYLKRMVDKTLSGGERKRIELASVLGLKPRLAILDEPDSGIDMLSTQGLIEVIQAFRRQGSAVLLITHREEIAATADRASQICDGRIVCTGSPATVAAHYKNRKCLLCDGLECGYERT
ncbi:ABC transporter ATP-binding protein [Geoalkalibacter halelectricus]|uniref:ABC transporter ATP-binding protein n=1 Tax=Geoalkalibacter halelectricus TaxID=2847045 RepID=A0ABY5ZNB3_9BACT|nr:ABC transporter ATP-binding protein [Geoalkalibacter halelectricus]MDO3379843.1 ABC transporter ATP-binding protein [Geoalkalibacter halelectricus]UWZ80625.1 ABC transporter ATP-binding protein [Geoalkalibacter halelectricus]